MSSSMLHNGLFFEKYDVLLSKHCLMIYYWIIFSVILYHYRTMLPSGNNNILEIIIIFFFKCPQMNQKNGME